MRTINGGPDKKIHINDDPRLKEYRKMSILDQLKHVTSQSKKIITVRLVDNIISKIKKTILND